MLWLGSSICGFEGMYIPLKMARWLSWLERRPVTAEVDGSNPFRVVFLLNTFADNFTVGVLAQLGEHLPYKQRVIGSSPVGPIECIIYQKVCIISIWANSRVAKGDRL